MKLRSFLMIITMVALGVTGVLTGCRHDTGTPTTATIGQPAPDFTLPDLNSNSVSLSDFKGHPVLLNFWKINCAPCLSEVGHLQAAYEKYDGDDLVILTVNVSDGSGTIKQFQQENSLNFPVLLDTEGKAVRLYAIPGVPTTFLIDRDGIVRNKLIGPFSSPESIDTQLEEILQ